MSWMLVFGFFFNGLNVGSYFGFNDCCWVFFNCFDLLGSLSELGQFFFCHRVISPRLYGLRSKVIS